MSEIPVRQVALIGFGEVGGSSPGSCCGRHPRGGVRYPFQFAAIGRIHACQGEECERRSVRYIGRGDPRRGFGNLRGHDSAAIGVAKEAAIALRGGQTYLDIKFCLAGNETRDRSNPGTIERNFYRGRGDGACLSATPQSSDVAWGDEAEPVAARCDRLG